MLGVGCNSRGVFAGEGGEGEEGLILQKNDGVAYVRDSTGMEGLR